MAACHLVAKIDDRYIGDPLDIEMFKDTDWIYDESHEVTHSSEHPDVVSYYPSQVQDQFNQNTNDKDFYKVGIIKRFDFSSALQCMSVIAQIPYEDNIIGFVKGSPEKIMSMSIQRSLPENFDRILQSYTQDGLRVLALAYKYLPRVTYEKAVDMNREEIEGELIFLGFLIMQNMVKPATTRCLKELQEAAILTIMATGDNGLTAISVGRECGIIDANKVAFLAELNTDENDNKSISWSKVDVAQSGINHNNKADITVDAQSHAGASDHPNAEANVNGRIQNADNQQIQSKAIKRTNFLIEDKEGFVVDKDDEMLAVPWNFGNTEFQVGEVEVAVTGNAFEHLIAMRNNDPENTTDASTMLRKVIRNARVFARMSPDRKALLVTELQKETKELVAMCGDGANDCNALKTADVGLSLSEAEASIAAPFTSKIQDISSMIILLREGRCSIITSFSAFKYIELYATIQFITVILLYRLACILGDYQYLYQDLFTIIPLSFLIGFNGPYHKLSKETPPDSLMSIPVLVSVLSQVTIQTVFQVAMYYILRSKSWYIEFDPYGDEWSKGHENTTLFLFSIYLYIYIVVTFSIGKPFRSPLFYNWPLILCVAIMAGFGYYMIIAEPHFLKVFLELSEVPKSWRWFIVGATIVYGLVSYLFEQIVVRGIVEYIITKRKLAKRAKLR